MLGVSAQVQKRLATAIGPQLQMTAGPVVAGVGLALLARAPGSSSYATGVLPAVLVMAVGLALTVARADRHHARLGSQRDTTPGWRRR